MYTDTVKELPVILYRTVHLGVSFLEGDIRYTAGQLR
jgi:hypothetical protein